jgi:hypothetical protein
MAKSLGPKYVRASRLAASRWREAVVGVIDRRNTTRTGRFHNVLFSKSGIVIAALFQPFAIRGASYRGE